MQMNHPGQQNGQPRRRGDSIFERLTLAENEVLQLPCMRLALNSRGGETPYRQGLLDGNRFIAQGHAVVSTGRGQQGNLGLPSLYITGDARQ